MPITPPTATTIDNAIARLQDLAQACTSVQIKSAPDYPIDSADAFPMSVGYLSAGRVRFTNKSTTHIFPVLTLEIHFSRTDIKLAYKAINAIALELPLRIAADPTLNNTVSTVIATQDQELEYEVSPFTFGSVQSQMLKFIIPFKSLQNPVPTT